MSVLCSISNGLLVLDAYATITALFTFSDRIFFQTAVDVEFLRSLENKVIAAIAAREAVTRQVLSSDLLHTMEGLISLPGINFIRKSCDLLLVKKAGQNFTNISVRF